MIHQPRFLFSDRSRTPIIARVHKVVLGKTRARILQYREHSPVEYYSCRVSGDTERGQGEVISQKAYLEENLRLYYHYDYATSGSPPCVYIKRSLRILPTNLQSYLPYLSRIFMSHVLAQAQPKLNSIVSYNFPIKVAYNSRYTRNAGRKCDNTNQFTVPCNAPRYGNRGLSARLQLKFV
jgi:hypothetical protein